MKLISVKPSDKPDIKYTATFCMCKGESCCKDKEKKVVHFGSKKSSTYIDHNDEKKKDAYIARHKVNENWNDPTTAGSLARYILWNKKTLSASISDFKQKFNL